MRLRGYFMLFSVPTQKICRNLAMESGNRKAEKGYRLWPETLTLLLVEEEITHRAHNCLVADLGPELTSTLSLCFFYLNTQQVWKPGAQWGHK